MHIKFLKSSIKMNRILLVIITIIIFIIVSLLIFFRMYKHKNLMYSIDDSNIQIDYSYENETVNDISEDNAKNEDDTTTKKYIKWVNFKGSTELMNTLAKMDITSHNNDEKIKYNWIELLAYFGCKYGGDLTKYKVSDLTKLKDKMESGISIQDITKDMKLYSYFYESYDAIFHDFIGNYEIEIESNGAKTYVKKYDIKVFSPIARGYNFSHYRDFGSSRSYGYKRVHLGNDLLGNIGTPIIAVESGYVEALGWNQYGGWRVGIRSFDKKRYYYYAHLRKDHPYAKNLQEGDIVNAGDVIGYLGMTGYSPKENVNNINIPHLHFGLQLIFDEKQKDGVNQIWIDVYDIIDFLNKNKSAVYKAYNDTNDYERKYNIMNINE